ncbi:unnamed protein product [Somion occarium]|uniref:Uncharacterized protein n=1 Tax=Somion occarium TaxID=3059160 RepID=A0ABP1CWE6_9APHY
MPEYVYALHNFVPEKPDEVPFKVGDRIEVIEKDDMYQDGWWQGRNPQGLVGLFPQTYTSTHPPASSTVSFPGSSTSIKGETSAESSSVIPSIALDTLAEEPESTTPNATSTPDDRGRTLSGEMMQATMTDVQKAIEQLGRNDRDGARSFSFVSSHGDYTDRSGTETEGDSEDEEALGWHKGAREKLAMRAKQENEERQAKEAAESVPTTPMRLTAPPIDVEMSDESEGEEDEEQLATLRERHSDPFPIRQHPHIPEEEEEEENDQTVDLSKVPSPAQEPHLPAPPPAPYDAASSHIEPSEDFVVPLPDESDLPTATAEKVSFPLPTPAADVPKPASPTPPSSTIVSLPPLPPSEPVRTTPSSPAPAPPVSPPAIVPSPVPESQQSTPQLSHAPHLLKSIPSTIRVGEQLPFAPSPMASPTVSTIGSVGPQSSIGQQTLTPATTVNSFKTAAPLVAPPAQRQPSVPVSTSSSTRAYEWSVEEVVEWLKSKGFDQGTCDKFIEITGDVLLELDQNILKNEIGVLAFGKRVRIINAIAELKRPPSPSESEKQAAAAAAAASTSRSQSISYSHSHTASVQSSAHHSYNAPYYTGPQFSPVSSHMGMMSSQSAPHTHMGGAFLTAENSPQNGEFASQGLPNGWRASDPGSVTATAIGDQHPRENAGLGLGLPISMSSPSINGKLQKNRPAQLMLSPSDGALKASAVIDDQKSVNGVDDRGVLSDSETTHALDAKQKRRRLFGRSTESSSLKEKAASLKDTSSSRHSRDIATTPISASPNNDTKSEFADELPPVRRRSKKGGDGERKASDRLSLFGSPFASTIGKSRKPPPRLSTSAEKSEDKPHMSMSTFSRIVHSGERRSSSRPSTSDGTRPKEKIGGASPQDRSILRKRTTSTVDASVIRPGATAVQGPGPNLVSGRSILEQIGTPDHNGWMRKKSDRYNTWKTRYFVLKGSHLYCLRSNNKSETKIKGYVNILGYRVQADENVDPGRYGFQIVHDTDKTHYFSSDEQIVIREWMKALMKATITRDYTNPVVSSSNIPTIPLTVAQAMNPTPRPPSPTAREATQRAHRRDNPNQLSTRDAEVLLMGMPAKEKSLNGNGDRTRLDSFFTVDSVSNKGKDTKKSPPLKSSAPPRPSREMGRVTSTNDHQSLDKSLIEWANSHLPEALQVTDPTTALYGGLALLRLAENIKGKPSSPPVPDSAFPSHPDDDKIDGLFRLFDFLLDNDVKMGSVSINDIRQGKRDKVVQLLRAIKTWEEKRKAIAQSIGKGSITAGPFMAMAGPIDYF